MPASPSDPCPAPVSPSEPVPGKAQTASWPTDARPASTTELTLLGACVTALDLAPAGSDALRLVGTQRLNSCFAVNELATVSTAVVGLAAAELLLVAGHPRPAVGVDRGLAALWFRSSIRPLVWTVPDPWDPIAGDYRTADGWIRLHTNAPHHRSAALRVLGCRPERDAVAAAVAGHDGETLEAAVVSAGGCAARLRGPEDWAVHPQGQAVAAEPLVDFRTLPAADGRGAAPAPAGPVDPARPLRGLRVLDLTRVLAGPIATRLLAGLGAEVLRVDPPDWNEPAVIPEVTLGKRCTRLDLRAPADRQAFEALLAGADLLIHGYRPGALAGLGYDTARRQALRPGLIEVSLCAWGWTGPWATRRGFDSLVQMASGIAESGRRWQGTDRPVPLPLQALDHATGQLMAAAALRALTGRLRDGRILHARLSLARTAALLTGVGPGAAPPTSQEALPDPLSTPGLWGAEDTAWGPALRLRASLSLADRPLGWSHGATALGSAQPRWQDTALD